MLALRNVIIDIYALLSLDYARFIYRNIPPILTLVLRCNHCLHCLSHSLALHATCH